MCPKGVCSVFAAWVSPGRSFIFSLSWSVRGDLSFVRGLFLDLWWGRSSFVVGKCEICCGLSGNVTMTCVEVCAAGGTTGPMVSYDLGPLGKLIVPWVPRMSPEASIMVLRFVVVGCEHLCKLLSFVFGFWFVILLRIASAGVRRGGTFIGSFSLLATCLV